MPQRPTAGERQSEIEPLLWLSTLAFGEPTVAWISLGQTCPRHHAMQLVTSNDSIWHRSAYPLQRCNDEINRQKWCTITSCKGFNDYTNYDVPIYQNRKYHDAYAQSHAASVSTKSFSVFMTAVYWANIWRAMKLDRCKILSETNTPKSDPAPIACFKLLFGKPAIVFWLVRCGETDVEISNYIADKGRDWHAPSLSPSTLQKETHLPTTEVAVFCKNPCL